MNIICVILAGGASRRMGRDKAALPLGDGTFLSRLVSTYSPKFSVYVSVGQSGKFPTCGAGELVDVHPGCGPLAGLEAAFLQTDADAVFLTATDLPFGALALAIKLCGLLGDADACVIRRKDGRMEPTFAVYRRSCLATLQANLEAGRRSIQALLEQVRVNWVREADLSEFPLEELLQNVNTPEEYETARCRVTADRL